MRRACLVFSLALLCVSAAATPAPAAVTIGQIGPPPMGFGGCGNELDLIQPSVSSGNPYAVPSTGDVTSWTLTAWTTLGGGGPSEQRALKVFRKVAEPDTFEVVAHDGPRALTPGGTAGNTFATDLQVKAGDVLGLHMTTIGQCKIDVSDSFLLATTDLADGQSTSGFGPTPGRLEVEAVVTPANEFSGGGLRRNRKKGNAILTFDVPNPGTLAASGKGVKAAAVSVNAGSAKLVVKAKGKKRAKLDAAGTVKLKPEIAYTPAGGESASQSVALKLIKRLH